MSKPLAIQKHIGIFVLVFLLAIAGLAGPSAAKSKENSKDKGKGKGPGAAITTVNQSPYQPLNSEPRNGTLLHFEGSRDKYVTLRAKPFRDPDSKSTLSGRQRFSQWVVTTSTVGDAVVYDSGATTRSLTALSLSRSLLKSNITYKWSVRYADASGDAATMWSPWSKPTTFVTEPQLIKELQPAELRVGVTKVGQPLYVNRILPIIAKNPWKLEQEAFIQTRIEDAKTTVPGTLISFKSDYNVTVYVAYDDRATTLPQWLWTFKPYTAVPPKGKAVGFIQNLKLMASDRDAIWRRLLVKDFSSAETIALGSNLPEVTTATLKMYNVIVQPKPMPKKK